MSNLEHLNHRINELNKERDKIIARREVLLGNFYEGLSQLNSLGGYSFDPQEDLGTLRQQLTELKSSLEEDLAERMKVAEEILEKVEQKDYKAVQTILNNQYQPTLLDVPTHTPEMETLKEVFDLDSTLRDEGFTL